LQIFGAVKAKQRDGVLCAKIKTKSKFNKNDKGHISASLSLHAIRNTST